MADSDLKIVCSPPASKPNSLISMPKNNDMFGNVSEERSESSSYHMFFLILIKVMHETHFLKLCCYVKRHNLEEFVKLCSQKLPLRQNTCSIKGVPFLVAKCLTRILPIFFSSVPLLELVVPPVEVDVEHDHGASGEASQ